MTQNAQWSVRLYVKYLHQVVIALGTTHRLLHHVAQAGMTTVLVLQARVAQAGTVVQAQATVHQVHQAGINYVVC